MATTSNKKSELLIVCNTKQAQDMLKKWTDQLKVTKDAMKQLADAGKTDSDQFRALDREAKNLSKTIALNKSNMERVNNVLNNLGTSTLRQVRIAARDLKKEMDKMSESDPKLKETQRNLQRLQDQMRKLKGETASAGNGMASAWRKTAMAVSSYLGVTMLLGKVKQMMTDVINLNLKYSDQLADIRKVSGLTSRDIDKLAVNLAKVDTRTSIQEMSQIAYSGAKLGMGKYGIEGLESFVNAANQVNVALKEDLGQDALTALSKMVEVMGLIPKMGVEQSLLATGSAMFKLASTSTADAGSIVAFSKRLTGMARAAGITTDQLLALGSASSSMALMPEVSATAFSKLITSLQTSHNLIEDALHIDKGTISNLFESGKLIDAIVLVFEKMHELGNMNAIDPIFKDLGSDGARLKTVMVTMSQNVDMLKEHLQTSHEAFEEGTAVTAEYNIQQETAQALMERASHTWEKAFVNPNGVDNVKKMAKSWYDLSVAMTGNKATMNMMQGLFKAIIGTITTLLYLMPALLGALMFRGIAGAVIGVGAALGITTTQVGAQLVATKSLTMAWRELNAVQKANWISAVIALVASLAIYLYDMAKATSQATGYMQDFNRTVKGIRSSLDSTSLELDRYRNAIDRAAKGSRERAAAIKQFNEKFGQYYKNMLDEKSTALDVAKAYNKVNAALRQKMLLEMREEDYKKHVNPRLRWAMDKKEDYNEYINATGNGQFGSEWLNGVLKDNNYGPQRTLQTLANRLGLKYADTQFAWKHRSDATVPTEGDFTGRTVGMGVYARPERVQLTKEQQALVAAARYISQMNSARGAENTVNKLYRGFINEMEAPVEVEEESHGTLENEKPDKDAIRQAQRAENERKEKLRGDLKESQDEARAVLDNIKNFYERQKTAVLDNANDQGWDHQLLESSLRAITEAENAKLSQARKAIAGQKNEWDKFKEEMKQDMIELPDELNYNQSQVLLDDILSNDLDALHKKIQGFAKALNLPSNAATNAIWKNATLNEKANATAEQRRQRERQKKLLEDNYTASVDNQYTNSMTQLGYFDVNDAQSKVLFDAARGPEQQQAATALLEQRKKDIEGVFATVREHVVELAQIGDVTNESGRNKLMTLLFGSDWDKSKTELQLLLKTSGSDLQQFYRELLKYSDDYTEALEKAHDRQKKLLDFQWKRSEAYTTNQHEQNRMAQAASGVMQHDATPESGDENLPYKDQYGTKSFISSLGADPEVEAYRLKMEAAAAYYDFLKAHNADASTLRDAEKSILDSEMAYAKSVAAQMKERMDDVYALASPIEDFGSAMGEAFATMTEDSEAGRKAVKAAIGDMIKGFMKQTVRMTQEYIKRRIMQKANDRLTSVAIKQSSRKEIQLEQQKQDEILDTQKLGGQAQEMLNTEVKSNIQEATAEIGQQTLQTQQAQTQQEVTTESAKTQANTTMGIASGASKIIGSLGWWGIPLVAVITALLNGLLSFAMSKVSSLFGGGSDSADSGPSTKLVSGMLTYDSGNVQAFRGIEDGKSYPVVGNDGKVYAATDGGELSTGLVRDPITTLVNGQPALVAERGPEMVIGRETTAAMMMARPDILAEIVKFDRARSGRTYRAYDQGNVSDFTIAPQSGIPSEDLADLRATMTTLATVLANLQKTGIKATISKYGKGGIVESAKSGNDFMRRNSGDRLWRD